jgi:hypothetical protein
VASRSEESDAAVSHEVDDVKYSVLIDVVKFVQFPKWMFFIFAAQVEGLYSLKDLSTGQ